MSDSPRPFDPVPDAIDPFIEVLKRFEHTIGDQDFVRNLSIPARRFSESIRRAMIEFYLVPDRGPVNRIECLEISLHLDRRDGLAQKTVGGLKDLLRNLRSWEVDAWDWIQRQDAWCDRCLGELLSDELAERLQDLEDCVHHLLTWLTAARANLVRSPGTEATALEPSTIGDVDPNTKRNAINTADGEPTFEQIIKALTKGKAREVFNRLRQYPDLTMPLAVFCEAAWPNESLKSIRQKDPKLRKVHQLNSCINTSLRRLEGCSLQFSVDGDLWRKR